MELFDNIQRHQAKPKAKPVPMSMLSISDMRKRLDETRRLKEKNRSYEPSNKHYLDVINTKHADNDLLAFLAELDNNISNDLSLCEVIESITSGCYVDNNILQTMVTDEYPFYTDLLKLQSIINEEKQRFYDDIEDFEDKHADVAYTQVTIPEATVEEKLDDDGKINKYYNIAMRDTVYYDTELKYVFFNYWLDKPMDKNVELLTDNVYYTLADYQLQAMYRSDIYKEKIVNIMGNLTDELDEGVLNEFLRYDGPSKQYDE